MLMQRRPDAEPVTGQRPSHGQAVDRGKRRQRVLCGLVCAAAPALLWAPAQACAGTLSSQVSLASQLVDRGLAISPVTPVLQGSVAWTSTSDWTLGLSLGVESRAPGKLAAGVAHVARFWSLSDNWRMQVGVNYYHYADLRRANVYEPGVYWIYRDVLSLGISGTHVVGTEGRWLQPAADLNVHWPLTNGLSLSAGIGVARYAVYRGHHEWYYARGFYRYGQLGLSWRHGSWRLGLDRIAVRFSSPRTPQRIVPSPWLATIVRSF